MNTSESASRRDLLITTARGVALAALAGGAALLTLRNRKAPCGERTACDRCGLHETCRLAAAPAPRRR